MTERKRIGCIFCDLIDEFHGKLVEGIIETANSYNIDVLLFSTLSMSKDENRYVTGEINIYNLINFDELDGIIVNETTFQNHAITDKVFELLKKCSKPVVVIGDGRGIYPSVTYKTNNAFELMVTHLIEEHHFKKIYCLTGPKGSIQAEERVNGYRTAMQKHGLEAPDEYIVYGDFWQTYAEKLAMDIINGVVEKPDAVACANDSMAIFLTNKLTDYNYRVPEDIAICGFDNIPESAKNVPSITSYASPERDLGIEAAVYLINKIAELPKKIEFTQSNGYIETRTSCGCEQDQNKLIKNFKKYMLTERVYTDLMRSSFMEEILNTSDDLNSLIKNLSNFIYLIKDVQCFYCCLCDGWDVGEEDEKALRSRYPEYATSYIMTHLKNEKIRFRTSAMLPKSTICSDTPSAYFFTPLHFNERTFGYGILSFGKTATVFSDVYRMWCKNLNNALELIRARELLYQYAVKDALTGLYNRRGFDEMATMVYNECLKNNEPITVISADLDNLKVINDNFGHCCGDNSIYASASILESNCESGDICARTGGDEFIIVHKGFYSNEKINAFKEKIAKGIDEYNSTSGFEFNIGVSVGFFTGKIESNMLLENLMTLADNEMYKDKRSRKGWRRRSDYGRPEE